MNDEEQTPPRGGASVTIIDIANTIQDTRNIILQTQADVTALRGEVATVLRPYRFSFVERAAILSACFAVVVIAFVVTTHAVSAAQVPIERTNLTSR